MKKIENEENHEDKLPDTENSSQLVVIDVICPVYNHELYIQQCLESIFAQQDVFVIVHLLDDASTDKSLEIVKKFKEVYPDQLNIYVNKVNQGNAGKSIAKHNLMFSGEYWTYIEGDDFLLNERKFISQIDFLKSNKKLIATATQCALWNVDLNTRQIMKPDAKRWNFYDLVTKKNVQKMYCHISSIVWKNNSKKKGVNPWPKSFAEKWPSSSEVLLVHLLLKKSRKYIEFQDIEGSCYRYTGKGIWSSLDENSKIKMNEALQVEIDSITPFWIKVKRTMSPRIVQLRARVMGGI